MRLSALSCAALVASLASPALAQSAAPVVITPARPDAPVDPAALEAARSLLEASGFESQFEQIARQNTGATFDTMMAAMSREQGRPVPEDLKRSVRAIIVADAEKLIADMKTTALDRTAIVYARYFTADELRELERLQTNPVMEKYRRIAPGFVSELAQIGVAAAAERLPALRARIEAAVKEWQSRNSGPRRDSSRT